MREILYQEASIMEGLLKNKQVLITVYPDCLEFAYSKALPARELKGVQSQISYVEKEIIPYDKVREYKRMTRTLLEITGYQIFFTGDFEAEKAGKRKKISTASIQTLDRRLWDALDAHTPLIPDEDRISMEAADIRQALENASVEKGVLEIAVGKQMIKTMRLFINDIEWKQYTYPPVRVSLPLGTYRIKIARGVQNASPENASDAYMDYTYTNEVTITLSKEAPAARLSAQDGFLSPNLKIISG